MAEFFLCSYAPHQAAPALRESASFSIQQGKFLQPMGIFVGGPAEYNRTHALPATPSTHGHHSYGNPQLGFLPHPITQSGQPIFRPQPVHENEDDDHRKAIADKRRSDRNLREQRRYVSDLVQMNYHLMQMRSSLKISQQIDQLKAILQNSGVDVKANKSNILSGVSPVSTTAHVCDRVMQVLLNTYKGYNAGQWSWIVSGYTGKNYDVWFTNQ
jgi:hypothetical protein